MNKHRIPFDDSQNNSETLEAMIRAAGRYVVPSDDLRPRTLEDARDLVVKRREIQRFGLALISGIALWGLSLAFVSSANAYRDAWVTPSGDDLQRIAFESNAMTSTEREWGLVEVFERLRRLRVHDLENIPSSVHDFATK